MPAENEELDVFKSRWRPFVNTLRGAPSLHDERVLSDFDRCFVPSLRRVFKLLKVRELVLACLNEDSSEIHRLKLEHHRQRDRAESYADHLIKVCKPGMTYRQAIDAFVHGACARIIDQAALSAVPSDNFPTIDDYRQASAIWLFRMEPRIAELVDQINLDPAKLRVKRSSRTSMQAQVERQLEWSLIEPRKANNGNGGTIPNSNQ